MLRSAWLTPFVAIALVGFAAQAGSASGAPHWVHYKDVSEGAFSMDVPAGWQVQGGMWRFGYFDARWMMTARTLDGAMVVRLDDVSVPPYALPGPNTGQAGQRYERPQQFQMMVADYQTAGDYAQLYSKHRFRGVCQSLIPRSGGAWRPVLPAAFTPESNPQKVTEASLSFECNTTHGQRIATVFARTIQFAVSSGTGYWVADPLISVLTTKQDEQSSYAIAQHMLDSWRKNPEWVAYQSRLTQMGLAQIQSNFQAFLRQTQEQMASFRSSMNAQVNGFESRMSSQAAQVNSFDENLVGIQNMSDPMTGESLQVFTGPHSNYYRNGLGQEINSDISPGPAFHQISPP